jgi:hypothetical protein
VGRWKYKSEHGTFTIHQAHDSRWILALDNDSLGSYHSPQAAADDVYVGVTGCFDWDSDTEVERPEDLSDWRQF